MSNLQKHEDLVKRYIRDGNTVGAIDSLLFMITKHAQQGDFDIAESMRNRISAIDPLALHKSVQAQEIIDSARSKPSGNGHMGLWGDLYDKFDNFEANTVYELMEKRSYAPGEAIFEEGGVNRNLYLIDQGQAKHIYTRHGRDYFIKKIKPGDTAGEENFFEASYCTTTLIATGRVKARSLSADRLFAESETPEIIFDKLKTFCSGGTSVEALLKSSAQDRRQHKRIAQEGSILIKPVKAPESKSMRGMMRDISTGGISFYILGGSKEQTQMLLGHELSLKFYMPPNTGYIKKTGPVLSIRQCDSLGDGKERYSIHMKFDEPLDEKSMAETANYFKMFNIRG